MTSLDRLTADPHVVVRNGDTIDPCGRCVVYRMRRSQGALNNPALETAIAAANVLEQPAVVFFGLLARHPMANLRHSTFMLEGLEETAQQVVKRRIGFVARICAGASSDREFARFCTGVRPSLVCCRAEARFARKDCGPCPNRARCTKSKLEPRIIGLQAQEHHETLCAVRKRQKTEEFRSQYAARAGVEGTHEQAIRPVAMPLHRAGQGASPACPDRNGSQPGAAQRLLVGEADSENPLFTLRSPGAGGLTNSPPVSMLGLGPVAAS
jgi:hypothetical protein